MSSFVSIKTLVLKNYNSDSDRHVKGEFLVCLLFTYFVLWVQFFKFRICGTDFHRSSHESLIYHAYGTSVCIVGETGL